MINNRQGGRRRGRGGQRTQSPGGRPDGNRQDNRQRGNAAQLLEKYKSMARDAQLGGDRVQTEYYLQFADHYFRVLSESRARFEDQRRHRDDDSDDEDSDEEMMDASDEGQADGRDDEQRFERSPRRESRDRPERSERSDRGERFEGRDRPRRQSRDENADEDRERGNSAPRQPANRESIPFDVLPPAIGLDETSEEPDEPRPRRRTRRPRAAEDGDIAPAA